MIAWFDQGGLRSDTAPPDPRRPRVGRQSSDDWQAAAVNVMSTVASRGALWFIVFTERFLRACSLRFSTSWPVRRSEGARRRRPPPGALQQGRVRLATDQRRPGRTAPGARLQPRATPGRVLNTDLELNVNASRTHNVDRLAREIRRFLRCRQRQPHRPATFGHRTFTTPPCGQPNTFDSNKDKLRTRVRRRCVLEFSSSWYGFRIV